MTTVWFSRIEIAIYNKELIWKTARKIDLIISSLKYSILELLSAFLYDVYPYTTKLLIVISIVILILCKDYNLLYH